MEQAIHFPSRSKIDYIPPNALHWQSKLKVLPAAAACSPHRSIDRSILEIPQHTAQHNTAHCVYKSEMKVPVCLHLRQRQPSNSISVCLPATCKLIWPQQECKQV